MSGRILVVDDILPNVKLLEAKLTAEYFEVLTAFDGAAALRLASSESPDLILLDVMMPGMDGFEVCERLKTDQKTRHIPVVMVTALSDVNDRVRGLEAGADDFLSKPVNDVALFARVRSLVRFKMMIDELRLRKETVGDPGMLEKDSPESDEDTSGARILLVESSESNSEKIIDCLSEVGHVVDHATTPDEGLRLSRQQSYDMIIAGLEVNGEDGLRFCSHLRAQDETRQIPILLLIDETKLPELAKGLELGVTDYLIQPIDRNELLARTRTQIKRRRYHDQLRSLLQRSVSMAYIDALTGLYNRRYMNTNLDRKIMEIAESAKPISIMMLDIDHFKPVNDVYGHAVGDEILKSIAGRMKRSVRDMDLVSRFGGEEFVVIMPDTPQTAACKVAERLRASVASGPFSISGEKEPVAVTVSIGVATTTDPMEEAASLLKRADQALYAAKEAGRNRVLTDKQDAERPEENSAVA